MRETHRILIRSWIPVLAATVFCFASPAVRGQSADLGLLQLLHSAQAEHVDQQELVDLVASGQGQAAFEEAFELGDELFETTFNALDGAGANVGAGQRFTRVPRADLAGAGEWANHFPARETGPNGQACNECHSLPFDDGAGATLANVIRDPFQLARLDSFIQRNTPHLFASGAIQRLAEEMNDDLVAIRDQAVQTACARNRTINRRLRAKGVSFGRLSVTPTSTNPCEVEIDTSRIAGVDPDLVIRPFQWKGNEPTLRSFNRGAGHNELGMQAVEIVGHGVDGDFDDVVDELTIGDLTALTIYLAAQPRPVTKLELSALNLIDPLPQAEVNSIIRGDAVFRAIGCDHCHRSALLINDPTYSEPSQNSNYRDAAFPAGQDPISEGVDPAFPVTFDLTADQPDNVIQLPDGSEVRLGTLEEDGRGRAVVRLYSDLKRHDMGPELAEALDETGSGSSVFITKELWGVGSTGPWLHDGRASTLTEAIVAHGGDARASQRLFLQIPLNFQRDLIAFLENLVLFKLEEEG